MRFATVTLIALAIITPACGAPEPSAPEPSPSSAGPPSLGELRSATYTGFADDVGAITLTDGRWEGAPYTEGAASHPRIDYAGDLRLLGDFDHDGTDEAVAFLVQSTAGTGEFLYLAVVDRVTDELLNTATALVGDRVQIRSAAIRSDTIVLEVVQAGEGDPMCCPGQLATRRWTLDGDVLREQHPEVTGRLSPAALAGAEWTLGLWDVDVPAPNTPSIALTVEGGRVVGSSGCNRYVGTVSEGDSPGRISIGPLGGTMMACPEEVMAVESRYLAQLGAVTRIGFVNGHLALTYRTDDAIGVMVFDRRDPSDTPSVG